MHRLPGFVGARRGRGEPLEQRHLRADVNVQRLEIHAAAQALEHDGVAPGHVRIVPIEDVRAIGRHDGQADAGNAGQRGRHARRMRDIFRAFRLVKRLRCGVVWVNHSQPAPVEAPWGGVKQSGIGRELGRWGADAYLETKQAYINLDETPIDWP